MTDFACATNVSCPDCGMSFCPEEGGCSVCADRDRAAFRDWLEQFMDVLVDCGMPARQAAKYKEEYLDDARDYFDQNVPAGDAAARELMGA